MKDKNAVKYQKIGRNISKYRKRQGLNQEELARMVNISKSYLSKIEAANCEKSFSLDVLFNISEVLNVDIENFFK